jgi:hypothetical protein
MESLEDRLTRLPENMLHISALRKPKKRAIEMTRIFGSSSALATNAAPDNS